MDKVYLYSDGACSGNPGPGGYGAILKMNGRQKEISGGCKDTTNNRMELMGIIMGLEALKRPCEVVITTDSKYVVDSVNKGWVFNWKKKNWMINSTEKRPNVDLWERLLALLEIHKAEFVWIKGHAGHIENEQCDALAVAQRDIFAAKQ